MKRRHLTRSNANRIADVIALALIVKQAARERAWWAFIKAIDPLETDFKAQLIEGFANQKADVLGNLKRNPKSWQSKADETDSGIIETWLFSMAAERLIFRQIGDKMIRTIITVNGARVYDELPEVTGSFDFDRPEIAEYVRTRRVIYADEILNTISGDLRATFAEGLDAGEGNIQLRNRIINLYSEYIGGVNAEGTAIEPWKAMRIARTETTAAANHATREAYRQSGVVAKKEWLATLDARVRDSHARLDGEQVELDKPFTNGLMFPGDPHGSAEEVCNCRCSMMPVLTT
jgi:SPP1 gp7 family putative phage head morphogenesis protein